MEIAVTCLSIVAALQAVALAFFCATVPFLWWTRTKDRKDLDDMDEVVAELLKAAGLDNPKKGGEQPQ